VRSSLSGRESRKYQQGGLEMLRYLGGLRNFMGRPRKWDMEKLGKVHVWWNMEGVLEIGVLYFFAIGF
jgi:hypothetical protein